MFTRICSTIFGAAAGLALVVGSAYAADDDIDAKVAVCAGCHGQNGVPADAKTMPVIWGQQQSYLAKQLNDYKSGNRQSAIMAPMVQGLAQADLRKVAAYFSTKTWPAPAQAAATPAALPPGIAQCQPCHQSKFEGGPPAPRLAGLSYEYLSASMRSFADGTRTNNEDMPKIMHTLSDSERDAIAHYLAAL